jgi:hypothetical protein
MSVQISYKKQIIFYVLLLIIFLTALEIIANVWWINETSCSFLNNEVFAEMDARKLEEICSDHTNLKMNEFMILPNQDFTSIHINHFGFRGPDFEVEKEENTIRVFFVGGSTTLGKEASSGNATIPAYLEKFFNEMDMENYVQVVNAGKSGFSSLTEREMIFNKIQYLNPDIVMMYDGWNNVRADYSPEFSKSHWNDVCDLGKNNGYESIIMLQPTLTFGEKPLTKQEYSNYLVDYDHFGYKMSLKKDMYDGYANVIKQLSNCTNTFDLRNVFENTTEPIYFDGGHMVDNGNEIIAKRIFDLLKEDVKNKEPNKNTLILTPELTAEFNIDELEIMDGKKIDGVINVGRMYKQLEGLLTFYKTPTFLGSLVE